MSATDGLARLLEDLGVPVRIGLCQQGHLLTVERMLGEGATWEEIGQAIGWHGETARKWYAMERDLARGVTAPENPKGGALARPSP